MKLNIVGSIFGTSGYDNHCRQLVNALYKLNPDIKLDVPLPQDWIMHVNDAELKMINNPGRTSDVTIMIATPPYWRLALGDNCKKFIGFLVWEGDKIPQYWLPYLMDSRVSQIWVPSKHTKDAILNTDTGLNHYYENKIKIVPHGVDLDIFKPVECKRDSKFTFVCSKGWRGTSWDRGGVQYLVKAFAEEFKKNEDVQLVLKLNPSYIHPSQVNPAMNALNLLEDKADIKVIVTEFPLNKLSELYCLGDVFVCTTRSEAFNLPGLEAMACGLATIQTNYGGQLDYMNEGNSIGIDYNLEVVKEDISYEGIQWGTPVITDIRAKLRYVFEHKEEIKEKGKQSLIDVQNWTWDNSANIAMKNLVDLN